jgi:hypothetical protein
MVKDWLLTEAIVMPRPVRDRLIRRSLAAAYLAGGLAALGACAPMNTCSTNFRGGCIVGPPPPSARYIPPAPATPAPVVPAVPYGDPSTFADADDKQCRSYGLTFGSHDYADCRIRLSAQHRGLDPNIGATGAGTPSH